MCGNNHNNLLVLLLRINQGTAVIYAMLADNWLVFGPVRQRPPCGRQAVDEYQGELYSVIYETVGCKHPMERVKRFSWTGLEDATEPRNFDFKTPFPLNLQQIKG